jgi:hypothetical protein
MKNILTITIAVIILLIGTNLFAQLPDEDGTPQEKPPVVDFLERTLQAYRDSQMTIEEVLELLRELATAQVVETNITRINDLLQGIQVGTITPPQGAGQLINILEINPDLPLPQGIEFPEGRNGETGATEGDTGDGQTDLTWDEVVAMIEQNGGRVLRASENMMMVAGWRRLPDDVKRKVEKFAKKKGKKLKTISPTVTGKLIEENGQYYMDVYVWTGQGDPNNIHVYKEYWDSLSQPEKEEIEAQAKAYGGRVIIENEKKRIKANLNTSPVEGAPSDEHLTQEEVEFLEQHVGEVITLHGWTVDGLINDGYTLEVVGLGKWRYEPYHPFDEIVMKEAPPLAEEEMKDEIENASPRVDIQNFYGIFGR